MKEPEKFSVKTNNNRFSVPIYYYLFLRLLICKYDRLGRILFPDNFGAFSVF